MKITQSVHFLVLILSLTASPWLVRPEPSHAYDEASLGSVAKLVANPQAQLTPRATSGCAAAATRINQTFNDAIRKKHDISRASLLIGRPDQPLFQNSYKTGKDKRYDLASLTKPIATATAIMRMKEMGKLKLSDPISKYLPEFSGMNITVDDLLRHRAALKELDGRYLAGSLKLSLIKRQRFATRAIAAETRRSASSIPPHTYRDSNYFLLSEIIRRIENKKNKKQDPKAFEKFVEREVLKPLKMNQSHFGRKPNDPLSKALEGSAGNAGLYSTTGDLEKFAKMMLANGKTAGGKKFLSSKSIKEMTTPDKADYERYLALTKRRHITFENYHDRNISNRPALRGAGFDLDNYRLNSRGIGEIVDRFEDFETEGSFGHMGSTGTSLLIDRKKNVYVIVLAQKDRADVINGLRVEAAGVAADLAITRDCEPRVSDEVTKQLEKQSIAPPRPQSVSRPAR
ncbi:MAG: hypothetical protein A2X94_10385 [Bdellovibrionales bacterium GWB1_55_8]|nr:MAG: hypothetical protein A2X94_10385 [Bdellovibrionales bacterium GWB1_55_8]